VLLISWLLAKLPLIPHRVPISFNNQGFARHNSVNDPQRSIESPQARVAGFGRSFRAPGDFHPVRLSILGSKADSRLPVSLRGGNEGPRVE
jgi:hypothetical protein